MTFEHDKVSRFVIFINEIAYMPCYMSRFVIFSNDQKSNIYNPRVFAGGAFSRRCDRAGPGRPRPAQPVIFSNHGPKPDPVCEIPMSRAVGPAGEIQVSLVVCPAWPVRFSSYFCSFFALVPHPPRGFEAATCSIDSPAQRCL